MNYELLTIFYKLITLHKNCIQISYKLLMNFSFLTNFFYKFLTNSLKVHIHCI